MNTLLWHCTPRRLRTVKRLKSAAKTAALVAAIALAFGLVGNWDYQDAVASDLRAAKRLAQREKQ